MFNLLHPRSRRAGFTLLELTIVMAVLGALVAGLFQLTSSSNRQVQDQVTAQHLQQYARATRAYLTATLDGSGNIGGGFAQVTAAGNAYNITDGVQAFLPGLADQSPQGFTYNVILRRLADVGGAPMFVAGVFGTGAGNYSQVSMGSVASLAGAEGAASYAAEAADNAVTTTCNETVATVRSAYGAVCMASSDFTVALPVAFSVTNQRPAALIFISALDLGSDVSQYLSRTVVGGSPQMTTMSTDLYIGDGAGAAAAFLDGNPAQNNLVMTNASNNLMMAGGTLSDSIGDLLLGDAVSIGGNMTFTDPAFTITGVGDITSEGTIIAETVDAPEFLGVNSIELEYLSTIPPFAPTGTGTITATEINYGSGDGHVLSIPFNVTVDGELRSSSFIYTSDERLKKDIEQLDKHALDDLLKVRGVTYILRKTGKKEMGVIAQDVEKVFPAAVTGIGDGYKGVNYGALIAPVIEAIRELKAENDALRERVMKLEAEREK